MESTVHLEILLKRRTEMAIREEQERRRAKYYTHPGLGFSQPDPWPESVSAAQLLPQLISTLRKHVSMDEDSTLVVALWIMHTHVLDAFSSTPRLVIRSHAPRAGKTTLLALMCRFVPRPLDLCAGTPAAVLWSLGYRPVLLIDNPAALATSKELRALLHNGCHRAAAHLVRITEGVTRNIDLFAPAAVTVEGKPPRILSGRSIEILLEPLRPAESISRLPVTPTEELQNLARMLMRWAHDRLSDLQRMNAAIGRSADEIWLPLHLVAADAGHEWEDRARAAMDIIRGNAEPAFLELLLTDIRSIIEQHRAGQLQLPAPGGKYIADRDRIPSADLARLLGEMEGRPWHEWGKAGQPLTRHALAILLAKARIRPSTARFHTADQNGPGRDLTERGYKIDQFDDAFARYLPDHRLPCAA